MKVVLKILNGKIYLDAQEFRGQCEVILGDLLDVIGEVEEKRKKEDELQMYTESFSQKQK
ncbi:MAG: hypothetical protein QXG39_01910 [Candidatus Aenigmatarchaeota archaeon]